MDVKGQVSAEYLLLTLVFLIIISLVTVPLIQNAVNSSVDVSGTSDASAAINSITNAVGIVYANGPGSKRTISVYFSQGGALSYNSVNSTLQLPLSITNGTKVIDSQVPIPITINNGTALNVNNRTNYVATITWPAGTGPININLN
jgi:uncharacterized protein (UPF0333 family)